MNENAGNVRVLRRRLGMSQEKFAAAIGVSFSTVSRWENAHNVPSQLSWRAVQELARQHGLGEDAVQDSGPANGAGPANGG
jgi:putative transcriptional regulator